MGSGNDDFLALNFALVQGWDLLGNKVEWHGTINVVQYYQALVPGIPQFKEKNQENETFQKQSAMLAEVVKLPMALVWHPPQS